MNAEDYKHTLRIRESAWFLRCYCWLWRADPWEVNVCKLFWGYLLAPLNLCVRLLWVLLWPIRWLLRDLDWEPKPKEEVQTPAHVSEFFARPWPRRSAKAIGVMGFVCVVVALGFGLVLLVPLLPGAWNATLEWSVTLGWFHLFVGYVLGVAVAGGLSKRYRLDERMKQRAQRKRAAGRMTFGDVLIHGAKAVKSNTCPRVELVEEER